MDMTASDVALLSRDNDNDFGGNSFFWIFALLILAGGGLGTLGYGGRGGCAPVTEAGLCNSQNFSDIKNTLGQIKDMNFTQSNNIFNAISTLGYQELQNLDNVERSLANGQTALAQALSEFSCTTQRAVDSVKFDMANYAATTNQLFTAGIQSVKDMFRDYQEQNLRDQNMRQYIDAQFCGIPRTSNVGWGIYALNGCNPCQTNY